MPEPPHRNGVRGLRSSGTDARSAIATTVLPFVLTVYLALRGGGYEAIVRSEVAVVIWLLVLLTAAAGLLPLNGLSRAGRGMLGLLVLFGAWSAVSLLWTESSERTVTEVARIATYVGVFALALSVQGRDSARRTVISLAAACGLIGILALLSRFHPSWFPNDTTADFLDYARARLNYPLNYWNGLAYLIAIGVPLLLVVATRVRSIAAQALSAAVAPALVLAAFYTISRGGAIALLLGVATLIALHPNRLALAPTVVLVAVASAVLIALATQRDALADGLTDATAAQQGDEMLVIVSVVCAVVALCQVGFGLASRSGLVKRPEISRQATRTGWAIVVSLAVVAAFAVDAPGKLSNAWTEFKSADGPAAGNTTGRFESASGNGRYQWWEASTDAFATAPIEGIGPGTFEFYWAREGSISGFVRDGHSLYLETLAETGVIGGALIAAFVLGILIVGVRRTLASPIDRRPWLSAATAGCVAFAVAAAIDWVWELAVLPAMFLLLAATLLGSDNEAEPDDRRGVRPALCGLAVVALVVIAIPLAGSMALRSSQHAAKEGDLEAALNHAELAADLQPWAASPRLQQALVLELQENYPSAVALAAQATDVEPTNWRNWFIRSRIESELGDSAAALLSHARAQSLNPRSALFQ